MSTESDISCVRIIVIGKVQGVFFRKHTQKKALELGIKGFVKNQDDGSVLIEACADKIRLNTFVDWCKHGPPRANVIHFELNEIILETSFISFNVIK